MSTAQPLLRGKLLAPRNKPFHLHRERLHRRLREAMAGSITLVEGGPGSGKTTLLARFLNRDPVDGIFYRLDSTDRDPIRMTRYLGEGLLSHAGESPTGPPEWIEREGEAVEPARLADLFLQEAQESLSDRVVLVLDGVEVLEGADACIAVLRRLLDYLPSTLHVILAGRTLPGLGAAALAARGEATLIRPEELLFTREETGALLTEAFNLPADEEGVDRIYSRTRGWVTALQLLRQTASLGPRVELPPDLFQRTEHEIFAYFSEEVLARESEEVRDFLLRTAVLPELDAELVGEVLETDATPRILHHLHQRNLFVSELEGSHRLLSYEPLFRDFLLDKLEQERGREGVRKLHIAYGQALQQRGLAAPALDHFLKGDGGEELAGMLGTHGRELLGEGLLSTVRQAVLTVVEKGLHSASLSDLLGEVCRLGGDYAASVRHFERALADDGGHGHLTPPQQADSLQGLAYARLKIGEIEAAVEAAEKGLIAAGDDPVRVARLHNTLSIARYRQDRHAEAVSGWQKALASARQAGDETLTLMVAHNLGLPHAMLGDFRRASECFNMLARPENQRVGPQEGAAYLNLARIAIFEGDFVLAAKHLDNAWEIARKWKLEALTADALEVEGNLLRETGRHDAAADRYARARSHFTELGLTAFVDSVTEEEAFLAGHRGDAALAERISAEILEKVRDGGDDDRVGSALLTAGSISARWGDPGRAIPLLEQAARSFGVQRRAFHEFLALLHLALAHWRSDRRDAIDIPARRALQLASDFHYVYPLQVLARDHPDLAERMATLPGAPPWPATAEDVPAPQTPPEVRADLTVRLFGPVEIYRDADQPIPPPSWKVRRALEIFCYLVSARQHRATKDRLMDIGWGDARPGVVRRNFHPTISLIRRALNHGHHVPKVFVAYESGAYLLSPDYSYDIDISRFESGIRAAREHAAAGNEEGARHTYDQAINLYRGTFLEELDVAWAEAPRAHYESLLAEALAEAAELHLAGGDERAGIHYLERRVQIDPLDEVASIRLMEALRGRGRRMEVVREYQRLESALRKAFRTDPSPEAMRLHREAARVKTPRE